MCTGSIIGKYNGNHENIPLENDDGAIDICIDLFGWYFDLYNVASNVPKNPCMVHPLLLLASFNPGRSVSNGP